MKINVVSLCSGYDAQTLALKRLSNTYPQFDFDLVAWSEIAPNAIKAHQAVHSEYADRNLGDMTTCDYSNMSEPIDLLIYSTPCFVEGTFVNTNRGYIPIEAVTTHDYVLTHTNQYQKVVAVGSRPNTPVIKVRGMCFNDIICTPNHPFWVRKRYRCGHKNERRFLPPEWLEAERLTSDYYVGYAINQKSELPRWDGVVATRWQITKNTLTEKFTKNSFWYLMGRYVGDGWQRDGAKSKGIVICCGGRNEKELVNAITDSGFNASKVIDKTVTKYFIYGQELLSFVKRYGKYAHGKMVDYETLSLPIPLLESFLRGINDSDGFWNNEEKCWQLTTVSKVLAYGIQQCVAKVYKRPCSIVQNDKKGPHSICGRLVNQRTTYILRWHTDTRKQDKAFYDDGFIWAPIRGKGQVYETATVYNMEVAIDNSYTANGAIVHNCQSVSRAGARKGMKEGDDAASALIWHTKRAIETLKPKVLILENVQGMIDKTNLPDFLKWQETLTDYGYTNFTKLLNTRVFGVAQNRPRVFMVSILGDNPQYFFPKKMPLTKRIKDYLEPKVDEKFYLSQKQIMGLFKHCDKKKSQGCGFDTQLKSGGGISATMTTRCGNRPTDPFLVEPIE